MGFIVGTRGKKSYKPPLLHRLLKPWRVTGNEINGLGETTQRRPRPVYHFRETPGVRLHFKWVQQLFYSRMSRSPNFKDRIEERRTNIRRPLPPIGSKVQDTPENWTRKVKEFALSHEADIVGIARMRSEWVYEGFEVKEPWIIMEGVAQDYEKIRTAPEHTTNMEVLDQYNRAHRANYALASWIREQGYHAERYKGFMGTSLTMIPAAIAAGFGQLGKHGSLIHRKYGPSFRLGYVLTDMPLVEDSPDDIPVDDFCSRCQVCTRECPTGAISDKKQMVRGVEKWYVDFDKCVPYFNDTFGCNVCIAVCPFTRPGGSEPLFKKLMRRRERKALEAAQAVYSAE